MTMLSKALLYYKQTKFPHLDNKRKQKLTIYRKNTHNQHLLGHNNDPALSEQSAPLIGTMKSPLDISLIY